MALHFSPRTMEIALYAVLKLLVYSLWGYVGLVISGQGATATWTGVLRLGVIRWLLGFAFGVAVFLLVHEKMGSFATTYVTVYAPVRVLEWAIVGLKYIRGWPGEARSARLWIWVALGVGVSFAADLASPE